MFLARLYITVHVLEKSTSENFLLVELLDMYVERGDRSVAPTFIWDFVITVQRHGATVPLEM